MKIRVAGVIPESIMDGSGIRTTIFFQGCSHACPGCHNPQTWSLTGGHEYEVIELINTLNITPLLSGFTFSGGEPFIQAEAGAQIAEYLKSIRVNLWVYTGYVWEELMSLMEKPGFKDLLSLTDVLVDGPYRREVRNLELPFRGSENQRIIRVQESLQKGYPVEWQG